MQMQDLSYKLRNDKIGIDLQNNKVDVSFEIFSKENVYTVVPNTLTKNNNLYSSNQIIWGDTENVNNSSLSIVVDANNERTSIQANCTLDKEIVGLKMRFDNLPLGLLLTESEKDIEINEYGHLARYPEGWRNFSFPLAVFKLTENKYLFVRVLHKDVKPVSFFIKKTGKGLMRVDVTMEEKGNMLSTNFSSYPVELGFSASLEEIYDEYSEHIKNTFALVDYKDNKYVPTWMKEVSLVVIMHMESFTGHIFHTYEKCLKDIQKLCEHIDGKRVLVYIAGWEGRYYYKYGNYVPDDRLGGSNELIKMVDGIHALGAHVLAMYGMTIANKNYFTNEQFEAMEFVTARGGKFHNGSVNWDGSHSYDFNDFGIFNPGSPTWQDYLYKQIKEATLEFNFDGAFLDIAACYVNDKRYPVYDGIIELCEKLYQISPEFLISGEGYYDGLSKIIPLFQSGHTDGHMNYHDRVSPKLFTRFSREFAHLCLGDLSRQSTGVHEQGNNSDTRTPLREGVIPTISLVEDTVDVAMDKVVEVLDEAKIYAERYL